MKVLLIHNYYRSSAPSGEDGVFRNELKMLEDNGVEVIKYEKFNDNLDDSTIAKRINIALEGAWSKKTYHEISAIIEISKPDIAHFHSIFPQISTSAYAACRDKGVPVIQTLHNFRPICPGALLLRGGKPCEECIGTTLLPSLINRCYRGSLLATGAIAWQITRNRMTGTYDNLVNTYIALTSFAKGRYVAAGFIADKIVIKPNFFPDIEYIERDETVLPYAVFIGRLSEEKGVRTLLKAWKNIWNLPLKIIGDGVLRAELEEFVGRNQLQVEFLGFLPNTEVLEILRNSLFQIIPSEWYEGFPMVVLEAYGLGIPIICSKIGSLEEIVVEGVAGLQFQPGDADDLVNKVNILLDNYELIRNMRQNGRKLYEQRYTAAVNFKMLLNIYRQAIQ